MTTSRGRQDPGALKLSHDRKVSPLGTLQDEWVDGKGRVRAPRWIPSVGNSFGLPSGVSCPGKTEFCVSCYAARLELGWPTVGALTDHNFSLLLDAGTEDGMFDLLDEMMWRYVDQAEMLDLSPKQRVFRIHWDGDYFNLLYARAWARVIRKYDDVQFWCYTRTFLDEVNVVPVLAGIPNLALYLSADPENIEVALRRVEEHPGVLLALCDVDYSSARALAPERPSLVCPENAEKIPLMDDGVGACVSCGLCVTGKRDVLFSTTHREHESDQQVLPGVPVEIWSRSPDADEPPIAERIGGKQTVPDGPKAGPGDQVCGYPPCDNAIPKRPPGKRGPKRLYCSNAHRNAMAYDRQKGVAHAN